jgi:hypothetical protein
MKANVKTIAKAFVILIVLTILPIIIIIQQLIPTEFIRALVVMVRLDIVDLLNRIAIVGVVMFVLVLIRGHLNKDSQNYLITASVWKTFWLFMVFFIIGIGHPETLGQTVLGSKAEAAENIVAFDFRLFAGLATIIVALMIVRSIIIFQETKIKIASPELMSNLEVSIDSS